MYPDFKELLSIFNDRGVKYLIVGGYAVSFHAQPRATKDLDILIGPDPENAAAVHAALAQFGAPIEGLRPADLIERGKFFRMGTPPIMVDIMPEISGVDFEDAWSRRIEAVIDPGAGLTAPIISEADLIAAKVAAARPQDLADVDAINKAKGRDAEGEAPEG
ncbi:MAG TPA: DUF6036 family nucleotidyltransferase [Roseiarcus sp.]|nr:DUF6036 family nucleotidyltransferase [Roseiarcus sp.]